MSSIRIFSPLMGEIRERVRAMPVKSIEITLKPVYLKNNYFYIPVEHTGFFPPGAPHTMKPIVIETGSVSFTAQLQYNSKAYV